MQEYRIEKDTMGEVKVPKDKYYGAQTVRSYNNFKIGTEKMPLFLIRVFANLKKACAISNHKLAKLSKEKAEYIIKVSDEIIAGKLDEHFPLSIWQTGSGTQTNMNLNEVIANRGNELAGLKLIHPNDDVNKSQSSNDTFPTVLHICAIISIRDNLFKALDTLINSFENLEKEHKGIIKIGRTHLQDATPLYFSDELSAYSFVLKENKKMLEDSLKYLKYLAIGATAVGTGLNAPKGFDELVVLELSKIFNFDFKVSKNKFHALSFKDAMAFSHSVLKVLSSNLLKIVNDIRHLSSGPRAGLNEIFIPENEPGSSIMPGKVNPTQCEALSMVCLKVMGNDTSVAFASSQGNFELNVYMPLIINDFLQSVSLLSDAINSFNNNCVVGIRANEKRMKENVENSLMLVTALNPHIGYEKAAKIAKTAYEKNISLKEAAKDLKILEEDEFDKLVIYEKMV